MKRYAIAFAVVALVCCTSMVSAAPPPPDARLSANPGIVRSGVPVTFTGFVGTGTALPVILDFADGAQTVITSAGFSLVHSYSRPGFYNALLKTTSGAFLDDAPIEVTPGTPRLPLGAIYSTGVNVSPALAGSVIQVSMTYRIVVPGAGFAFTLQDVPPALQAIIDLEDDSGNLVHRSDPTPIFSFFNQDVQLAVIQYSVPVDARGAYHIRAFIQAVDRGTVAAGAPTLLDVIGNSPGDSIDAHGVHAAGSVELGHRPQISGETVNPGMVVSSQQSVSMSQVSVFSDPVSQRVDPLLALSSLLPANLTSPNSLQTQPKQPAALPNVPAGQRPQYYDALGRSMAAMPDILGGFSTLRGVNLNYRTAPGWTFQGSVGNTELFSTKFGSPQTFEQLGDVIDVGRSWSASDSVQLIHHGRGDNSSRFLGYPQNVFGPQIADVNAVRATHGVGHDLSVAASAAFSGYSLTYNNSPFISDSADLISSQYDNGYSRVALQYHNFGQSFTPGEGMQAQSDRAGMVASAFLPLSKVAQFALNWDREATRSVIGTQTTTGALFNVGFAHGLSAQASAIRDRELTQVNDVTTNTVMLNLGRGDATHTFLMNGAIISAHDFIDDRLSLTSRTGSAQYSFQHGIQAIGFGINALDSVGDFRRSVVTESLTDGVSFGGVQRKVGFQVGLANSNTKFRIGLSNVRTDLTGSLTYRIARGITLGFKGERTLFHSRFSQLNSPAGGMRFVLIVER